jgi:hypothetical protein
LCVGQLELLETFTDRLALLQHQVQCRAHVHLDEFAFHEPKV